MQRNIKSMIGFAMAATDGEIGKVDEFYFDDETWTIRYLIVKTGGWLLERKVLISPAALKEPDWENESFPVNLTKDQVKHSPDIDTEMPVSRQQELTLYNHYQWPYGNVNSIGFYGGMGMLGMMESRLPFEEAIALLRHEKESSDPHLRSMSEIKGYRIHATDGEIGEVSDLMVDENWKISALVVDTGHWFPGKKVLVSPTWITELSWGSSSVNVNVSKEAVKNSPELLT
ncbi:PRC-barrel domain containing protein [Pedobacter hiemivivus]|uniref:PRC-barrel domain containing protein n=1 Tax=Pedobacter hiemivivus TaxID=2530454 RepID=A0A4U1G243_9SPHI|nr:PRC-barrel domain-containing protein [Pedobacter hiemivivus]TCC96945.1 PRC-barrel domain containing protein [Pedobacter hiemivivus]TKC57631.1 PRC-barrel domain containing protein [Pedobacter hiemivivus]